MAVLANYRIRVTYIIHSAAILSFNQASIAQNSLHLPLSLAWIWFHCNFYTYITFLTHSLSLSLSFMRFIHSFAVHGFDCLHVSFFIFIHTQTHTIYKYKCVSINKYITFSWQFAFISIFACLPISFQAVTFQKKTALLLVRSFFLHTLSLTLRLRSVFLSFRFVCRFIERYLTIYAIFCRVCVLFVRVCVCVCLRFVPFCWAFATGFSPFCTCSKHIHTNIHENKPI